MTLKHWLFVALLAITVISFFASRYGFKSGNIHLANVTFVVYMVAGTIAGFLLVFE